MILRTVYSGFTIPLAAIEGGDGVHEHVIQDGRLSFAGAAEAAIADILNFASPISKVEWETEDYNALPGRQQAVSMSAFSGTLTIDRVEVYFLDNIPKPRLRCEASSIRQSGLIDVVAASVS